MPKTRAGDMITIPISDEFAAVLFEGRGITGDFQIEGSQVTAGLLFSSRNNPGHSQIYQSYTHFIEKVDDDTHREFFNMYPSAKIFKQQFFVFEPAHGLDEDVCMLLSEFNPRRRNTRLAYIYGVWDISGPRLVLKWLASPKPIYKLAADLFAKKIKEYDAAVSGKKSNIGERIQNREEILQKRKNILHLSSTGSERRALPESVLKHIAEFAEEPESKRNLPSAALARLFPKNNNKTKKHGGARRRATLRKH